LFVDKPLTLIPKWQNFLRHLNKDRQLEKQPRLQSQMVIPASRVTVSELKPMPVAEQFLPAFDSIGSQLKVFFPMLLRCSPVDWGDVPLKFSTLWKGISRAANSARG